MINDQETRSRVRNEDQLVVSRQQLPCLQLGSIFLCNDCLPVADPCSHAIEWPLQAVFKWGGEQPPDVFRDCGFIGVEMSHLSVSLVLQFVGPFLVISAMAIKISQIPDFKPLLVKIINHLGGPVHGILLLGGVGSNVISLTIYPLLGHSALEKVGPPNGFLGSCQVSKVLWECGGNA